MAKLQIINSFSTGRTGGNPAGVFLDADNLTRDQKQKIAFEAGVSETAFVSRSSVADFKLEFFTPTRQIAHCGHATIATFWHLNTLGKIKSTNSSKETIDGTRDIYFIGDEPFMEQQAPRFVEVRDPERILRSVGMEDVSTTPIIGNTGNSFLLIELDDLSKLENLTPNFDEISKITSELECIGYYVFASSDDGKIQTRMFAPFYGISEESATGMAAGPLACHIYPRTRELEMIINQGKYMSPRSESILKVKLNALDGKIDKLLVGGSAYINKTLEINQDALC